MIYLLAKILVLLLLAAFCGAWLARWWLLRHFEDVTTEYQRLLEAWHSWRKGFEEKLAQRPTVDLQPLIDRSDALDAAVREVKTSVLAIHIPTPLPTNLNPLLTAINSIPIPPRSEVDLQPVHARLSSLERSIADIKIPTPKDVDLSGVHSLLEHLSAAIAAIRMPVVDLGAVLARLAAVEQSIRDIVVPPSTTVDLSLLLQRLDLLDTRAAPPAPVAPSISPVSLPSPVVRAGSRNLLAHAAFGAPDDLQQIKGVAKVLEQMMHGIGVYYFWQIAEWTPADVVHADAQLTAFKGRITRDSWVQQAQGLAQQAASARKPAGV